ncbi:transposase [Streptomyces sp. NPDC055140]
MRTEGIADLFEQFPDQVGAPPLKPKKNAPAQEWAAYEKERHQQSSERICVEHANAEHKQWRPLQRYLGRREYYDQTHLAIAGLVSDRSAER